MISYVYDYIPKEELLGYKGYVLSNYKAVFFFIQNIKGSSLLKGEIDIKKDNN